MVWDRATGEPIHPAVVWQSRASADICERLKADGLEPLFRARTGPGHRRLLLGHQDPLDARPRAGAQARAEAGELLFGTVDSWLIWRLTGGRVHVTDVANASRTLLFNIDTLDWDDELLELLRRAARDAARGARSTRRSTARRTGCSARRCPIAGIAGDQQAALFGQACFRPGQAKNTYGTGCFLLVNTGAARRSARRTAC